LQTGHGPSGYGGGNSDNDFSGAHSAAMHHADNDEDSGMFSQALGFLQNKQQGGMHGGIDEQQMIQAHEQNYNGSGSTNSNSIGAAGALQALKMFSGGQGQSQGGGGQNAFIGLAMSQAANLFNQKQANGQVVSLSFSFSSLLYTPSSISPYDPAKWEDIVQKNIHA